MKSNPFRQCLDDLNDAENAWFDSRDLEKYALWAKNNTGLLRGALHMLADGVDSARRKAEAEREATDNISPPTSTVYN